MTPNCANSAWWMKPFVLCTTTFRKSRESQNLTHPSLYVRMRAKPICSIDDCLEPAKIRGFCDKHFPVCSAEGCENLVAKRTCIRHYKTNTTSVHPKKVATTILLKTGFVTPTSKPKKQCKQPGCTKWSQTGGFCVSGWNTMKLFV